MTPKQFIVANSERFAEAVANGLDIRMEEDEIFEWMQKYRAAKFYYYLKKGEIVQDGDEVEMSANCFDISLEAPHSGRFFIFKKK